MPQGASAPQFNTPISPASKRCLQQGCDSHAEENGPDELAGGPLVVAHAHGVGQQKGHGDGATEARQVVLWATGGVGERGALPLVSVRSYPNWSPGCL